MNLRSAATEPWQGPQRIRRILTILVLGLLAWGPGLLFTLKVLPTIRTAHSVLPIVLPVAVSLTAIPLHGVLLRITRQALTGADRSLPPWVDGGRLLREGTMLWAVVALWSLPAQLVRFLGSAPHLGGLSLLATGISIAVFVAQPAAIARLAATGSFPDGLDTHTAFVTVRSHLRPYLRLAGFSLVSALVLWLPLLAGLLTRGSSLRDLAIITIGTVIALTALACVQYHLFGQVYRQATTTPPARSDGSLATVKRWSDLLEEGSRGSLGS